MFDKLAPSGLEMMLRNMGLASVLDAAKQLAENGAVQKIIDFADNAGEMNERLGRIEAALGIDRTPAGGSAGNLGAIIDGTVIRRSDEPGSDNGNRSASGG